MDEIEQALLLNFREFYESGNDELSKGRYNSAVSSYFKAIAILCDYEIYKARALLPKNHSERFLFLQTDFREAYELMQPLFKDYRDSYNMRLNEEDATKLRKNVEKLANLFKIEEKSK